MYISTYEIHTRRNNITIALLLINLVVYILASIWAGRFIDLRGTYPMAFLGQVNAYVVYNGWFWQLFTSMFIHFDIMHLGFNLFWLYILGTQYERLFGGGSLLITYIASGLAGNILTLLFMPPLTLSAGASGAVFGIFGALLIIQALLGGNIMMTLMYGFFILLINSLGPGINILAHAGGFSIGLLIGYLNVRGLRRYLYRVRYRY